MILYNLLTIQYSEQNETALSYDTESSRCTRSQRGKRIRASDAHLQNLETDTTVDRIGRYLQTSVANSRTVNGGQMVRAIITFQNGYTFISSIMFTTF
jgi:hypothetical protein